MFVVFHSYHICEGWRNTWFSIFSISSYVLFIKSAYFVQYQEHLKNDLNRFTDISLSPFLFYFIFLLLFFSPHSTTVLMWCFKAVIEKQLKRVLWHTLGRWIVLQFIYTMEVHDASISSHLANTSISRLINTPNFNTSVLQLYIWSHKLTFYSGYIWYQLMS